MPAYCAALAACATYSASPHAYRQNTPARRASATLFCLSPRGSWMVIFWFAGLDGSAAGRDGAKTALRASFYHLPHATAQAAAPLLLHCYLALAAATPLTLRAHAAAALTTTLAYRARYNGAICTRCRRAGTCVVDNRRTVWARRPFHAARQLSPALPKYSIIAASAIALCAHAACHSRHSLDCLRIYYIALR